MDFDMIGEFLNFDWDFVFSNKFCFYGVLVFWFFLPCFVFISSMVVANIICYFMDYSDFKAWRKEQNKKD